jgi:HK97 family phage major capsid protein
MRTAHIPRPPAPLNIASAIAAADAGDWRNARAERDHMLRLAESFGAPEPDKHTILIDPTAHLLRDLNASTGSAGGFLVQPVVAAAAGALRPTSAMAQLGAQFMVGGKIMRWPRITGQATTQWLASESDAISESDPVFGERAANVYWVGAMTDISRQLLLQSDAPTVVEAELLNAVLTAIDQAVLGGSGAAGQPLGLAGTSGVAAVTGTGFSRAAAREMQRVVHAAGGIRSPESVAYVMRPAVSELLGERAVIAGSDRTIFEGSMLDGTVVGARAVVSQNAPASTILFGDFSQIVVHFREPVRVQVSGFDPTKFRTGVSTFRCLAAVDVVVRQPAAFAVAASVT